MHQVATSLESLTTQLRARRLFAADLIGAGACSSQVETFQELFPNGGVVPTLELCLRHAGTFAWNWAAEKLLSPRGYFAYKAATAQALAAHDAATAQALAACEEAQKAARDQAWDAANEEAWDQAWGAYHAARAQASYDEARAQAWFEQWSYDA